MLDLHGIIKKLTDDAADILNRQAMEMVAEQEESLKQRIYKDIHREGWSVFVAADGPTKAISPADLRRIYDIIMEKWVDQNLTQMTVEWVDPSVVTSSRPQIKFSIYRPSIKDEL